MPRVNIDKTLDIAASAAREDAAVAIDIARSSGDEPVEFITGNSYMPPLRAFGSAERFWNMNWEPLWDGAAYTPYQAYFEAFEETLAEANVYLDCPEYDNALYVVDMTRFEYVLEGEGFSDGGTPYTEDDFPTLSSEWRKVGN